MSDSELGDLSRDELEERVRDLEERVNEIEERTAQTPGREYWNHFLSRLLSVDIEDYGADPFQHIQAVEEVGAMIQRCGSVIEENEHNPTADTKSKAWQKVVALANNVHGTHDHYTDGPWVGLYWQDIKSATGYSDRRCKELIHEFGEEMNGARWRPYIRSKNQRKRLDVNTDVWGDG